MLVILNNFELKSYKEFICFITNNDINYKKIKIISNEIFNIIKINFIKKDKEELIKFIKLFKFGKENNIVNNEIFKYINKVMNYNSTIENYKLYIEYRKINKYDCKSDKYYKILYGEKWKEIKNNEFKNRKSVYDPVYISKKYNITINEAKEKIKIYKKDKVTSLNGFIKRWGEDIGKEKFKKFQETSKHSKEKYIDLYGLELGLEKWEEFVKIKKRSLPSTIEYWEYLGYTDVNIIKDKISHFQRNNTGVHMEYLIKTYGEDNAKKKWDELNKKKGLSLKSLIEKYGYDLGYKKWSSRIEKMIKTNIKLGIYLPSNKKNIFTEYRIKTINITKLNLKLYGDLKFGEGWENLIGNIDLNNDYHVDHNFSIKEGFINNIDPNIIGHIENLQLLTKLENCTKKANCNISIEELLNNIEKTKYKQYDEN